MQIITAVSSPPKGSHFRDVSIRNSLAVVLTVIECMSVHLYGCLCVSNSFLVCFCFKNITCLWLTSYWQILPLNSISQSDCPCLCGLVGFFFLKEFSFINKDRIWGITALVYLTVSAGPVPGAVKSQLAPAQSRFANPEILRLTSTVTRLATNRALRPNPSTAGKAPSTWRNLPVFRFAVFPSAAATLRKWPRSPLWLAQRGRMLEPVGGR